MQVERKTGLSSGEGELGGESRRGLLVGRNLKLDRVLFRVHQTKPLPTFNLTRVVMTVTPQLLQKWDPVDWFQ